jgi:hypothetical protein
MAQSKVDEQISQILCIFELRLIYVCAALLTNEFDFLFKTLPLKLFKRVFTLVAFQDGLCPTVDYALRVEAIS